MAIVPMQKVALITHQSLRDIVLDFLQKEEVLEVCEVPSSSPPPDHSDVRFREANIQYAIDTLMPVASRETLTALHRPATPKQILHAATHTDVNGIVEDLRTLEQQHTSAEQIINESKKMIDLLTPWQSLSDPLSTPRETEYTVLSFGALRSDVLPVFKDALSLRLPRSAIGVESHDSRLSYLTAHIWKEDRARFEELATTHGWTDVDLPRIEGTVPSILDEAHRAIQKVRSLHERILHERQKCSVHLPHLLRVRQFMRWLDAKEHARECMTATRETTMLLGWIPSKTLPLLEDRLRRLAPATALLRIKPDAGEHPPVLLKNSRLVTPFQSVTNLYGLPLPSEMDPTGALSPFFILFFALCLTDAGYGALLATIFGAVVWKTKKTVQEAPLLWLLCMGGILTFFVGILFGGWFGLNPNQVPAIFTKQAGEQLLFKGQIWNLNTESGIAFFQNLAIGLGLTHLSFGMFLAGYHKWIHGNYREAFWVDFTSHLLIGAGVLTFLLPTSRFSLPAVLLSLALFIWGKGYGSPWYLRPLFGILGLLNFTIGMLSNTLSYLRLLALGLVTGALAMAVNMVAVEFGKLFPMYLAIPISIAIIVLGHLVSIALNTLGSFIHSGRLQFIEFFSQFFTGGGRPFSPLHRSVT